MSPGKWSHILTSQSGWQISPLHGKNQGNYPVSADTAEILSAQGERGETKFGENFQENTQLIQTLTVWNQYTFTVHNTCACQHWIEGYSETNNYPHARYS